MILNSSNCPDRLLLGSGFKAAPALVHFPGKILLLKLQADVFSRRNPGDFVLTDLFGLYSAFG